MRRSPIFLALLPISALSLACGSSDDETGSTGDDNAMTDVGDEIDEPVGPQKPDSPLLEHVLWGDETTMPCEGLDTGHVGDELCILPPDPEKGVQLHAGPLDYDDPDQIAEMIIEPGDENTEYFGTNSTNTEAINFYHQRFRMRPGSHHLIMLQQQGPVPRGWQVPGSYQFIPIGGTQLSAMDFPPNGVVPPEDELLGRPLLPETGFVFQMHYVNATDEPILREAWVNIMSRVLDEGVAAQVLGSPFMEGAQFAIEPLAQQTLNYECEMTQPDMRIVSIFGHRHSNADRFTAWVHRDGVRELVYEDYDWAESAEIFYNSIQQNPAPDRATALAGGYSGIIELQPGDKLEWECEINNRQNVTLTYSDAAYTGEMCNVFGSLTTTGFPIWYCRPPPRLL